MLYHLTENYDRFVDTSLHHMPCWTEILLANVVLECSCSCVYGTLFNLFMVWQWKVSLLQDAFSTLQCSKTLQLNDNRRGRQIDYLCANAGNAVSSPWPAYWGRGNQVYHIASIEDMASTVI